MDFFHENSIYVVLFISLIIWFGLVIYIFNIDRKISELHKKVLESDLNITNKEHQKDEI